MTGQVKEEILTRFGELGVSVKQGQLIFKPALLRSEEFLAEPSSFSFSDIAGEARTLPLQAGTLAFTYCQVPVIYSCSDISKIKVFYRDGSTSTIKGNVLDAAKSQQIFDRDGQVDFLQVEVMAEDLQ